MLGQGIIVVYQGSGVVNFAQGALAMVGAFLAWELHEGTGWSFWPAFAVSVLGVAALGACVHLLIMRPMRRASPLARLIATLGVLAVLTSAATLIWGAGSRVVVSELPREVWRFQELGLDVTVGSDRVYLFGIACVITAALWALYRFTTFGIGVRAAAEDEQAAAALGWSPDVLAALNWALGGALAAVAGIFVVPLTGLQVNQLTLIVIAALAAALAGGFRSFPLALAAGAAIGVAQSELARFGGDLFGTTGQQGLSASLPFAAIIVVLVIRGQSLPLRSHILERLPRLGSGVVRPVPLGVGIVLVGVGTLTVFDDAVVAAVLALALAIVLILSLVVLTGYAGQLSLGQAAIAGIGAFAAGRLVSAEGWPFELALVAGVGAGVLVGVGFALPALRTRGVNLAVVTLGLGFAVHQILLSNSAYTGGIAGTPVGRTHLLGIDIDGVAHKDRYLIFVLVCLLGSSLLVANLRRGSAGRRLIAVRTNERAAAALGISVFGVKVYAFAVSAGIAGLAGVLIGFQYRTILFMQFQPFESINAVLQAVIGGIGYVVGSLFGAQFAPGTLSDLALGGDVADAGQWIVLAGGVVVLVLLIVCPDGLASVLARGRARSRSRAATPPDPTAPVTNPPDPACVRVPPKSLDVRGVAVRLGGVDILHGVDLAVEPGTVVGLIGPNGAGKTMLIDAITGFAPGAIGSVCLDGQALDRCSAARRARAGIARSFQSLELFEDITVAENLQAASDHQRRGRYLSDLIRPRRDALPAAARAVIHEFELASDLERQPAELAYGRRRLVGVARAVAGGPSVLLLDEPAAGLSDVETTELAHLVRRLATDWGMGVLLVEHDVDMVMDVCDRIVVLDFGRVIAEGAPDDVRRDPAVLAAYLGQEQATP